MDRVESWPFKVTSPLEFGMPNNCRVNVRVEGNISFVDIILKEDQLAMYFTQFVQLVQSDSNFFEKKSEFRSLLNDNDDLSVYKQMALYDILRYLQFKIFPAIVTPQMHIHIIPPVGETMQLDPEQSARLQQYLVFNEDVIKDFDNKIKLNEKVVYSVAILIITTLLTAYSLQNLKNRIHPKERPDPGRIEVVQSEYLAE